MHFPRREVHLPHVTFEVNITEARRDHRLCVRTAAPVCAVLGCVALTGSGVPRVGEEAGRDSRGGARRAGHDAGAGHCAAAQAAGPAAACVHPCP